MPSTATVSPARAAVAQRVERRDARAHQRRGFGGADVIGDRREACERHHDILLITAVHGNAGDLLVRTGDEAAAPARVAVAAICAEPSDADPLSCLPPWHVGADRVDDAGDLVSGHARIGDAWPVSFFCQRIAVTQAARLHLDTDFARTRLRNRPVDHLKPTAGPAYLHCAHGRRHTSSSFSGRFSDARAEATAGRCDDVARRSGVVLVRVSVRTVCTWECARSDDTWSTVGRHVVPSDQTQVSCVC
jgi:hypothetical protein